MTDHAHQKVDVAELLDELQALYRESNETLDALTAQIREMLETLPCVDTLADCAV